MALGEAVINIQANVKGLLGGLNKASAKMKKFGAGVSKAGKAIAGAGMKIAAFGASILGALLPAILQGSKFQQTMADAASVIGDVWDIGEKGGETISNFELLNQKAKDLGISTQFSASQVAEAMKFMGMAGMSTMEITEGVGDVLNLAAAGSLDLARAADIATDTMSAFNMKAADLGRVNDVMAATASKANTSIDMMGESFKYAAPLAAGLGQSIETVSTLLGALANKGIKASSAGTSLNQAMATLATPTEVLTTVLRRNGLTFDQVSSQQNNMIDVIFKLQEAGMNAGDMIEAFGKRGGRAMLALVQTSKEKLEELRSDITNSFGSAAKQAAIKMNTMTGDVKKFWSAVEGFNITIFEQLEVAMRPITQWITGAVMEVTKWVQQNQQLVGTLTRVAAAIGVASVAIGSILMVVGGAVAGLGGLIAVGPALIAAVGGAVVALISFKAAIIAAIVVVAIPIIAALAASWEELKGAAIAVWQNGIKPWLDGLLAGMLMLWSVAEPIWNMLVQAFKDLWNTVTDFMSSLAPFKGIIKGVAMAFAMWTFGPIIAAIALVVLSVTVIVKWLEKLIDYGRRVADFLSGNFSRAFESAATKVERLAAQNKKAKDASKALADSVLKNKEAWDASVKPIGEHVAQTRAMIGEMANFEKLTPLQLASLKKKTDAWEKNGLSHDRVIARINKEIKVQEALKLKLADQPAALAEINARLELLNGAKKQTIADSERHAEVEQALIDKFGSLEKAYEVQIAKAQALKTKTDDLTKAAEVQIENSSKLKKLKEELADADGPILSGYAQEAQAVQDLATKRRELIDTQLEALELEKKHNLENEKLVENINKQIAEYNNLIATINKVRDAELAVIAERRDNAIKAFEQTQEEQARSQEITLLQQADKTEEANKKILELKKWQIENERQETLKKIDELFNAEINSARDLYQREHEIAVARLQARTDLSEEEKQAKLENLNAVHTATMTTLDAQQARNAERQTDAEDRANKKANNDILIANNQRVKDDEAHAEKLKQEDEQAQKAEEANQRQQEKTTIVKEENKVQESIFQKMAGQVQTVQQAAMVMHMMKEQQIADEEAVREAQQKITAEERRIVRLKQQLAKEDNSAEREKIQNQLNMSEDSLAFERARLQKRQEAAGLVIDEGVVDDQQGKLDELLTMEAGVIQLKDTVVANLNEANAAFLQASGWVDMMMTPWSEKIPVFVEMVTLNLTELSITLQSGLGGILESFNSFTNGLTSTVNSMEFEAERAMTAAKKFAAAQQMFGGGGGGGGSGGSPGNLGGA